VSQESGSSGDKGVRLDIWLDVSCLFKTRSQAQTACNLGRVEVNGQHGKAHRLVRPGDELRIGLGGGRQKIVVVRALADQHLARAQARALYEDLTPPPTPEEVELRRMQRLAAPPRRERGAGAPKKKERRALKRLKEAGAEE
jgi:ribosome-associated heat shock protein Hsp15